jgi:hypothetical protein
VGSRGGAGQGMTDGDLPRRQRDDGAEEAAEDGSVQWWRGSSGGRRRVWRSPTARGRLGGEEAAVD